MRAVLVLVVVGVALVAPAAAGAFTVEQAVGKLVERLSVEPHLEHFASQSVEVQSELEHGLADTEFLNSEYAGRSLSDFLSHYSITGVPSGAEAEIASLEADVETGVAGLADGGSTAFLAGGEGLDAAGAVLGTATLSAGVGTVALGAGAFAAGYFIGEKLMEVFHNPFVEENQSEPTFEAGLEVEAEAWQRVKTCSGRGCEALYEMFAGSIENYVNEEDPGGHVREGPMSGYSGGGLVASPVAPGKVFYALVFHASPATGAGWFFDAGGFTPLQDEGHEWPFGEPDLENEELGCGSAFTFANVVEGWPPHVNKSQLATNPEHHASECTPYELGIFGEHIDKPKKEIHGMKVMVWRKESQMPVNFPKPGRTCHEGFTCAHTSVPGYPSLGQLLENLPDAFDHANHENLNHTIEHFQDDVAPLPGSATVPSCAGLSGSSCKSHIEHAGFTNVHLDPLTWEDAHLDKLAGALVEVTPPSGTETDTGHEVRVITNPAEMPLIVPAPVPNELYTTFETSLLLDGFSDVTVHTLSEAETNPNFGPNTVVRVLPRPGTRVDPLLGPSTEIELWVNPESAVSTENPEETPQPEPGGGLFKPPAIPAIGFPHIATPCNVFPFGIPCWVAAQLSVLVAPAEAPHFSISTPFSGTLTVDLASVDGVDLSAIMEIVRPILLFVSFLGIVYWLGGMAMGGSTGGGSAGED